MPVVHPAVKLSGRVFCSWNTFSFVGPVPDDGLRQGDLIVWSWSGKSETPKSRQDGGLFRVSVHDGKTRRWFKVKNTRVHRLLKFESDSQRESQLNDLVRELLALRGRSIHWQDRGYQVSPQPAPPAASAPPEPKKGPAKQQNLFPTHPHYS